MRLCQEGTPAHASVSGGDPRTCVCVRRGPPHLRLCQEGPPVPEPWTAAGSCSLMVWCSRWGVSARAALSCAPAVAGSRDAAMCAASTGACNGPPPAALACACSVQLLRWPESITVHICEQGAFVDTLISVVHVAVPGACV